MEFGGSLIRTVLRSVFNDLRLELGSERRRTAPSLSSRDLLLRDCQASDYPALFVRRDSPETRQNRKPELRAYDPPRSNVRRYADRSSYYASEHAE